jgi:hypothetical protein
LLRHRALTQVCRSGSDLGSRGTTAMATRATMDMAIIPIPIIGRTLTITTGGLHSIGPEAIDITATIVTITIGIKVT